MQIDLTLEQIRAVVDTVACLDGTACPVDALYHIRAAQTIVGKLGYSGTWNFLEQAKESLCSPSRMNAHG